MPNAIVNGSPRSIGRSPGLSSPSVARGPAVSIRWHDSGVPFHSSSRDRLALASCPGRSPRAAAARRCEVWHAAHSNAASWSTSLITRSPSAGVDQEVGRRSRPAPPGRSCRRSSSTRNAGTSIVLAVGVRLPADDADPARRPGCPRRRGSRRSGRDRSRGWPGRLRSWNRMPPHRQRRGAGHARSTRCPRGSPARRSGPTTSIASSNRGSNPVR